MLDYAVAMSNIYKRRLLNQHRTDTISHNMLDNLLRRGFWQQQAEHINLTVFYFYVKKYGN